LYVSGIVATGFRAKGGTLSFLADRLIAERQKSNVPIYTRRMTKDALRLAEGYKFIPVNSMIPAALEHIFIHYAPAQSVGPPESTTSMTGNRLKKLQRKDATRDS